jgi:hypothetical protein
MGFDGRVSKRAGFDLASVIWQPDFGSTVPDRRQENDENLRARLEPSPNRPVIRGNLVAEVANERLPKEEGKLMSRTVRFAAALLTLVTLTCGSLGALPLGPRPAPTETEGAGFLTAVVEWLAAVFAPERTGGDVPQPPPPQSKDTGGVDPLGGW